eukprot:gene5574-7699_t
MGVPGLLQSLKSISKSIHISSYASKRVAVDASCWIHKGMVSSTINTSLMQDNNIAMIVSKHVEYFMNTLKILTDNRIRSDDIIVVFDGKDLPGKDYITQKRRIYRETNLNLCKDCLIDNKNHSIQEALSYYHKSLKITDTIIYQIILQLKKQNYHFIVAPYEADAQLAYLAINHLVDLVITEDSDAIVYGCKNIMFKFNKNNDGKGDVINRRDLAKNTQLSFNGWKDDQFKLFCCLADQLNKFSDIPTDSWGFDWPKHQNIIINNNSNNNNDVSYQFSLDRNSHTKKRKRQPKHSAPEPFPYPPQSTIMNVTSKTYFSPKLGSSLNTFNNIINNNNDNATITHDAHHISPNNNTAKFFDDNIYDEVAMIDSVGIITQALPKFDVLNYDDNDDDDTKDGLDLFNNEIDENEYDNNNILNNENEYYNDNQRGLLLFQNINNNYEMEDMVNNNNMVGLSLFNYDVYMPEMQCHTFNNSYDVDRTPAGLLLFQNN